MKVKNFIFLLIVLLIIAAAFIAVAPSISDSNRQAESINQAIEAQRQGR